MKLEQIGFYTLSDERARTASSASQMKRCEIIIIESCNFKCPYCRGLDERIFADRSCKQLTLDEVTSYIDMVGDLESIRFSGGEPTLHPHLGAMVAYAKMRGVKNIAISTNGSASAEKYRALADLGVNDFAVSFDAADPVTGDMLAGVPGAWRQVRDSIRLLSELAYTSVCMVVSPSNVGAVLDTIKLAYDLDVDDVRVVSDAQHNGPIPRLREIPEHILEVFPILRYRAERIATGRGVRGLCETDNPRCPLVLDDTVLAGQFHYPCPIYMREQGEPIGKIGPDMRTERDVWAHCHEVHKDPICQRNCLDFCIQYNNRYEEFHKC